MPDGTVSINTTAAKVEEMANKIIDNAPVENSVNLISSGAVYSGLKKAGEITSDGGFAAGGGTCRANGGGAIGLNADTITGGAVGSDAVSFSGGAIGQAAVAGNGFAGGRGAESRANYAAQICIGTNETDNTLQFKNFRLVEANGKIPLDRLDVDTTYDNTSLKPASGTAITESFTKNYISAGLLQGVTAGERSTAEGRNVSSIGTASHAEGTYTTALGPYSHAEGNNTIATAPCSHVEGKYNVEDLDRRYIHIVGIGSSEQNRKNAHTIDISGNAWYLGKITQDGTPTAGNDVTTKTYVDASVESVNDNVTALQSSKENVSNKVTSFSATPSDTNYPSEKLVFDSVEAVANDITEIETQKEDISNKVTALSSASTDTEYPSAKAVYDAIQAALYVDSEATV